MGITVCSLLACGVLESEDTGESEDEICSPGHGYGYGYGYGYGHCNGGYGAYGYRR